MKLVRVDPAQDPGITRQRRGTGFSYALPDGARPGTEELERIKALAVPPAWTDVWICPDPRGHILAAGTDAAGRRQLRYNPAWREERDELKFDRILALAEALPAARGRVTRDLRQDADAQRRTLAVAFRILDDASPRVGSVAYLERYGSQGLTTLRRRDASIEGGVITLDFPAKEHTRDRLLIDDRELAGVLRPMASGDRRGPLLSYPVKGRARRVSAESVNGYVHETAGTEFSAKDFRTLRGTVAAAKELARQGAASTERAAAAAERAAVKAASEALCNTPAVARASYVDPRIFEAYREGRLLDLGGSPDAALLRLLG